ncbi:transglutaminase family protein [Kurthia sibirica]|uniref:Transglutaminase n=1 Tax=Kurthia sibirica TaxID=202750 RepID=A0A2U3AJ90_9BACL|nr:transglutaminase domain-containing protein [Kurthia sibirica]PWI24592.1 transglutaminase [Kurthia sibirica]GEK33546.1 hypothetical protein KSI01_10790 [Kurthia sibirica]
MNNQEIVKWVKLLFLYSMIFLMLREWLMPIMELTDTGHFSLLLAFIVLCLLTNLFNMNAWLSGVIKLLYIIWFMLYVHSQSEQSLLSELTTSVAAVFTGDWQAITNSFKSLLFFILLWMTVYLIHHWLTIRRSILFFFLITVIFLALLDTFTSYDANDSIIRTMIIGMALTGILFAEKTIHDMGMKSSWKNYGLLIVPLVGMLFVSTLFAMSMPKYKASENLPKPLESVVNWANTGMNTTGKIGYVENDDQLGGDFEADDTPILQYMAKNDQYLRIETKSLYTGKGWTRPKGDIFVKTFEYGDEVTTSIKAGPARKRDLLQVEMNKKYDFIMQPYGLEKITKGNAKSNKFYIEMESGKIRPTIKNEKTSLTAYTIQYSSPVYSEKELEESRVAQVERDSGLSKKERKEYLQIPKAMPVRVAQLAQSITEDKKSVYDKANAVVDYFNNGDYKYSRTNVAVPKAGQDYVDQFLFDTKLGYCDNFSTSMVMMMRSIGVPTRWVKGFSEGNRILSDKDDTPTSKSYVVTNNNAHSWVEVYIPNVGWMSFEPTIGFSGFDQVEKESDAGDSVPGNKQKKKQQEQQEAKNKEQQQAQEAKKQQQEKIKEETKKEQKKKEQQAKSSQLSAKTIWIIVGAIAIVVITLFIIFRKKWLPALLIWRYKKQQPSLEKSYEAVLKRLKLIGLTRLDGETLTDFAKRVDAKLQTNDMSQLTTMMEKNLYNPNAEVATWNDFKECWENLINQTRG